MAAEKRARGLLLPLLGVVAALILFLPLVPQSGLQERLTIAFAKVLQSPCQIRDVRLKLLPRPALKVYDLACSGPDFSLQLHSLDLVFSPLSLLSFSPLINGFQLHGVFAEIPFKYCSSEVVGEAAPGRFLPGLLENINPGRVQLPATLSVDDAVCKLTGVPGCKSPLLFSKLAGVWQMQAQKQSENLALTGELDGGLCTLKVTRYKVAVVPVSESAGIDKDDSGDRLEINCRLQGVSMLAAEALALGAFEHRWQVDFADCDFNVDINGNPDGGLRFTGKFAVLDHHLWRSETDLDKACLWSQGLVKANFSGFFQNHDGYLNLKNLFLQYPEAATLTSRGLVRFREPVFVNLVNHIKVDDLARTISNCPPLDLPGYQYEGRLESDLKLVGNPFSAPVLKLDMNSEKIVLRTVAPASENLVPVLLTDVERVQPVSEKPERATLVGGSGKTIAGSGWRDVSESFLLKLAEWQWIVKSDCRIDVLELPGLHLAEFSFVAEKNLVQLEVERLAARFGRKGQVRLSLILDDFLQGPRWQASLVVEKLDLKPFKETLQLTGVLEASLVGGGRLGAYHDRGEELDLKGKWQLRQGVFFEQPLFVSFEYFLEREGGQLRGTNFSNFSGGFVLRDKVLRFEDFKINFSSNRLLARGRFFTDSKALDFRAQFSDKEIFFLPFHLSGPLTSPKFSAD